MHRIEKELRILDGQLETLKEKDYVNTESHAVLMENSPWRACALVLPKIDSRTGVAAAVCDVPTPKWGP